MPNTAQLHIAITWFEHGRGFRLAQFRKFAGFNWLVSGRLPIAQLAQERVA